MVRGLVVNIFRIMLNSVIRTKIIGKENIPNEGAAIICPNHIHIFDSVSVVVNNKRKIYVMAKEELFKSKIGNWFFRDVGAFPVSRGKGDTKALDTAGEYLKNGELLLVFPEGTRNGLEKGIKFKKGAAYIAIQNKVPIIPVGIVGTFKPFSKTTINIGKPIDIREYVDSEKQDPRKIIALTNKLQEEVIKLRDEIK